MNIYLIYQAPGQVAYDYNQSQRDKNKQWLADLGMLKVLRSCSIELQLFSSYCKIQFLIVAPQLRMFVKLQKMVYRSFLVTFWVRQVCDEMLRQPQIQRSAAQEELCNFPPSMQADIGSLSLHFPLVISICDISFLKQT